MLFNPYPFLFGFLPVASSAPPLWKGMIGVHGVALPQAVPARLGSAADLLTPDNVRMRNLQVRGQQLASDPHLPSKLFGADITR